MCSVPIKEIPVVCEPFEVRGTQNKSVGAQLCTGGESAMCIERTNSLCTEAEKSFKKQPGLLGSFPSTTFKNEWKLLFGPESNGAEVLWPTGKTCEESGHTLLLESGGHYLVPAWSLLTLKMRRKPGRGSQQHRRGILRALLGRCTQHHRVSEGGVHIFAKYFEQLLILIFLK